MIELNGLNYGGPPQMVMVDGEPVQLIWSRSTPAVGVIPSDVSKGRIAEDTRRGGMPNFEIMQLDASRDRIRATATELYNLSLNQRGQR